MRIQFAVAVLIAGLISGCIGAPGKAMTAREGLADAETAAKTWAGGEDLHLLAITAIEPFRHLQEMDDDGQIHSELILHLDRVPGDGRAPGWLYVFAADNRCVGVMLAAGLGVLAEGHTRCENDGMNPLPGWSVDSDAVAKILAGDARWPQPADNQTYFWQLEPHENRPVWSVEVGLPGAASVRASVDADSGLVLDIGKRGGDVFMAEGPRPVPQVGREESVQDTDSQTLLAPGTSLESAVEMPAFGRIEVHIQRQTAVGALRAVVHGPGLEQAFEVPSTGMRWEHWGPPGQYTLTVTADGVAVLVSQSVTGSWGSGAKP